MLSASERSDETGEIVSASALHARVFCTEEREKLAREIGRIIPI